MAEDLEKLEKTLGGKLEGKDSRVIPGTFQVAGQEVIYFSDDGINPPRIQFRNITRQVNPPHLKSGGASERGCTIRLPDGLLFHAMSYHGDIDGWRKQIKQGAQELKLLTATVKGDSILISDGRELLLASCKIEFS